MIATKRYVRSELEKMAEKIQWVRDDVGHPPVNIAEDWLLSYLNKPRKKKTAFSLLQSLENDFALLLNYLGLKIVDVEQRRVVTPARKKK